MPAKSPEQQAVYDSKRKRSEQLLVRLTPEEADRVRTAAASSGQSVADFMLARSMIVRRRSSTSHRSPKFLRPWRR